MKNMLLPGSFAACALHTLLSCSTPAEAPQPAVAAPAAPGPVATAPATKYGRGLLFYAEVDKAGDYFRRMFVDTASARQVARTGELPAGALLVLETWFGSQQSTVYIRQRQADGSFGSGSFAAGQPDFSTSLTASCDGCHATAARTTASFTLPLLRKALQRRQVQFITCDQPSFTPCDLAVYQGQ